MSNCDSVASRPLFSEFLGRQVVIFDGAMGTEIYRNHVFTNVCYDNLNCINPKLITQIHQSYLDAGVDVLTTNTYGANRFALEKSCLGDKVEQINAAGAKLARAVADSADDRPVYVAGSVGPLPRGLQADRKPTEEEEIACVAEQVSGLIEGGCDFIFFETLPSRASMILACRAMEQFPGFPFVLSCCLSQGKETRDGDTLETLLASIPSELPQPVAFGLNCGAGPEEILESAEFALKHSPWPVIVQPNAGIPKEFEGRQLYYCSPEYISTYALRYVNLGAVGVGGCCGTTPEHLREIVRQVKPLARSRRVQSVVDVVETHEIGVPEQPLESRSRLAAKLCNREWVTSVELTPPRGFDLTDIKRKSTILKEHGVDSVNLPDGPRASSRIASLVVAERLKHEVGIEPILHFCCRDRNLIGMQADLLASAACDIHNILFITGDPPKVGKYPDVTGVFDTDSIGMIRVQTRLNRGLDIGQEPIKPATNVCIGCGLDPTSLDKAREIARFRQKVEAGAHFAVTQPVFDFDAFCAFLDQIGDTIPIIAGVWPLTGYKNALFMKNEVPGVVVPDSVMTRMEAVASQDAASQLALGIEIAQEAIERIRLRVCGVQVSAPFGRIEPALSLLNLS